MGNGGCGCAVPVLIFDHLIILFFLWMGTLFGYHLPTLYHPYIDVHCMHDVWT